ncbi:esterase family protein [Streptomyces sp. NBC_01387]|uniref:alpha/beta hydrolase n=1 Tax=unclassified Streptomyces TaxID=2593676 RepID=UPI0020249136|nr:MULTISPECIES: alpha/beta fold hydrolase [unclassified Streptomyces]MCX4551219.1 esterase family protein [Streptomyces sp. NBC_01500]WSC22615.1 esterase family protein [Streptomyces sp. NBC_01766]WSV56458.1 esterase family protein [Streptomyces sp. NBC_01014]
MYRLIEKYQLLSQEVETWEWPSRALDCDKRVSVLRPVRRNSLDSALPVLFLLHGFGGTRLTWLQRTRLIEHLAGLDLMVVIPESGRRWFINDHRGMRYEDYLIGEVVPFADENIGADVRKGRRAIGGFSMGGATALMQALRHPGLFSTVISHAGAFEAPLRVGDPYSEMRQNRDSAIPSTAAHERVWGPPGSPVRLRYNPFRMMDSYTGGPDLSLYFDVGSQDYARIIGMNRNMALKIEGSGIDFEYHEREGGHDLRFLDRSLPFSLAFAAERLHREDQA